MTQRLIRIAACSTLLTTLVLAARPALGQGPDVTADPTSLLWGRQFTEWFYGAEADSIFGRMDADNQKQAESPAGLLKFLSVVQQEGGIEEEVLSEDVKPDTAVAGAYRYLRRAKFSNLPDMVIRVVWVLTPEKKISGFNMQPEPKGE